MMGKFTLIKVAAGIAVLLLCSVGFVSEAATLPDCSQSSITELETCVGFLTGTDSSPSSKCCIKLASVEALQPLCLCDLIAPGANVSFLGQTLNDTRALALPGLCKVAADPAKCPGATVISGTAPSGSPAGSPPVPGNTPRNSSSSKISGKFFSIVLFAAVPAIAPLLLRI